MSKEAVMCTSSHKSISQRAKEGGREKVQRFHLVTSKESKEGESKGGREQGRMRVRERAQHLPLITSIVFIVYLPNLPPSVDQLNKQVSRVSVGLLCYSL